MTMYDRITCRRPCETQHLDVWRSVFPPIQMSELPSIAPTQDAGKHDRSVFRYHIRCHLFVHLVHSSSKRRTSTPAWGWRSAGSVSRERLTCPADAPEGCRRSANGAARALRASLEAPGPTAVHNKSAALAAPHLQHGPPGTTSAGHAMHHGRGRGETR